MRHVIHRVCPVVLCLLAVTALHAQQPPASPGPRLVRVTGVFVPASGDPTAEVETLTLALYAEETGGLSLWEETQNVAVDAQGRYAVLLGATLPEGLPVEVLGAGEARWLGRTFARPGESEQQRVLLTGVPYALKAADADTLGGRPASAYVLADPDTSGGGGATDSKAASGAPAGAEVAALTAGTTNFVAKFTNATDLGNSALYDNGVGRIGVNTTTPLDVVHARFTDTSGGFTGLAVQNLGGGAASYSGMLFYDQNGALGQFQGFNNSTHEYRINNIASNPSINFMTGSTSRFYVRNNGNIGIGTTAPSALLEVSNAVPGGPANMWMTSYTNAVNPYYMARRARGTFGAPTAVQNGDGLAGFYGEGYGATAFGTGFAGGMTVPAAQNWTDTAHGTALTFTTTSNNSTTAATRMTISHDGNVGLGTTTPGAALEVVRETGTPLELHLTRYAGTSSSGEPNIVLRTARGTRAAPTAVQALDELGGFTATGYGATGFGSGGVGFGGFAAETWTDSAQGSVLAFGTTPLGSTETQITMITIPNGHTGIGIPVGESVPVIADRLQVFGDIRVGTTGTNGCLKNFAGTGIAGTCASDQRFKRDITSFGPVLRQLTALQPVHYFWRAADFPQQQFGESRAYGLIAQDVEQVLPDLVVTNEAGFKAVDYSKLPLLTIQAVKELKAENEELKAGNEALKHRLDELELRFTDLFAIVASPAGKSQ